MNSIFIRNYSDRILLKCQINNTEEMRSPPFNMKFLLYFDFDNFSKTPSNKHI